MSETLRHKIPADLEDAVGFNLYRVGLLFRRELMIALKDYDLTPEQWQVLVALWSATWDVNQQDLCELTLKDKHAMSRILTRMERDDWVRRRPDPTDRRATFVTPTRKAQTERDTIRRTLLVHFEPILSALPPDDSAHLMRSLHTFRDLLETKEQPT